MLFPSLLRAKAGLMVLLIGALLATTACSRIGNAVGRLSGAASGQSRVELEGTRFRARLERNRDDTRQVVISVTPVAVNPEGAQEAGRLEATKYCLKTFGSSDTAWEIGPDLPVEELEIVDDRIVLVGRCTQR